jgi:uncharacterized membrane protein YccC
MPQAAELPDASRNKRRRIAFFIAVLVVFCVGAIFSTVIYDNSPAGTGRIFGEFIGAALVALVVVGIFARRATYMPAAVVAVAGRGPICRYQ